MRTLLVYRDNQYPRYLQIIPTQVESVMVPEKNNQGDTVRLRPGRMSRAGNIDIVTTPDQPVKVGDEFQTPVSIIRVDSIVEERPAKGNYIRNDVQWMRCQFSMVKNLLA